MFSPCSPSINEHKIIHVCSITLLFFSETAESRTNRSGESQLLQEMEVKISELEEASNLTRSQLVELRIELKSQKKAMENFTTQVKKML